MLNTIIFIALLQVSPMPQGPGTASMPVIGQICQILSNGNIVITPNVYYGNLTIERGPNKVTLAIDLPKNTQICNETESGAICKTIDELFKVK